MVGLRLRLSFVVALLALGWFTVGWQTTDRLSAEDQDKVETAPVIEDAESGEAKPADEDAKEKPADEKDGEKGETDDEKKSADKDKKKKSAAKNSKSKSNAPASQSKTPARRPANSARPGASGAGGGSSFGGSTKVGGSSGNSNTGNGGGGNAAGPRGPAVKPPPNDEVFKVFAIQDKHSPSLMKQDGIVGVATTFDKSDRRLKIVVMTNGAGSPTIPKEIEGVPVIEKLSGPIYMSQIVQPIQQTRLPRPVPIGTSGAPVINSCALPTCYSGTIGCRLKARDGSGYYALSNNHVFAFFNNLTPGNVVSAPSPGDVGCNCSAGDNVGTLFKFKPFDFDPGAANVIDAAIIKTDPSLIGNSTLPTSYGTPKSKIMPLPEEAKTPVVAVPGALAPFFPFNLQVQKFGRTTGHTNGEIFAFNATLVVNPPPGINAFAQRFARQIIIVPTGTFGVFSAGGDSGSLIVTEDRHPVALLFAGGGIFTIGNPIGDVLKYFDMDIDGEGEPLPPGKNGKGQPNSD